MSHPTVEPRAAKRKLTPWADPGARPLVRFDGVSKRFGGVAAVDALTLDIYGRVLCAARPVRLRRPRCAALGRFGRRRRAHPARRRISVRAAAPAAVNTTRAGTFSPSRSRAMLRSASRRAAARGDRRASRRCSRWSSSTDTAPASRTSSRAAAPARRARRGWSSTRACCSTSRGRARQEAARRDAVRADASQGPARPHLHDRHP